MCVHICTCIFTYINTHMYIYKFSSISQSCPTLCDPTHCSMPGFPVHHKLPELTQTMPIDQWCHLSISSSVMPRSFCLQSLPASSYVQWVSALPQVAKVYWSFSFSISTSNEYSGLISFRMDWLDLLAVQGTLKSLLQHHSSKASILMCSAFFIVQFSHPYMTTGKT